jgi:hypothetical protein
MLDSVLAVELYPSSPMRDIQVRATVLNAYSKGPARGSQTQNHLEGL